jgi:arylsulfatase A-like enzyme
MPPNLLYIFADQLTGFSLGCTGHPDARTPHLDALAGRGTVMQNACTSAPVCTPARITMWTGRYAATLGALDDDARIPEGIPTMADAFRDAGYLTSYVGKWHIGGTGNVPVPQDLRGGFESFAGFQCHNEFRRDVRFFDEKNHLIEFPGRHRTDATFDLAIARLRAAAADGRPFLLCVSEQAPHYPCQPSEEFLAPFRDRPMSTRPNTVASTDPYTPTYSPPSPAKDEDPTHAAYGGDLREYLRHYHAAVSQVDAGVGRLLAELHRLGLADSTIIVFSSDHGDMQGSHGLINKGVPYEESIRIPFVVAGPGIPREKHCPAIIGTVDFFPTFAGLCGVNTPSGIAGHSLAGALTGHSTEAPSRLYSEDRSGWAMVRESAWKLVADLRAEQPRQLFALDRDPFERMNLMGNPYVLDVQNRLMDSLRNWRKENPLPPLAGNLPCLCS